MMSLNPYTPHVVQDNVDRVVAADHNNQETQLVALTNNVLQQANLPTETVQFGTVGAGGLAEKSVFVAPYQCILGNLQLVNSLSVVSNPLNNTRLDLVNKGSGGIGNTVLATFDGAKDAFTAFDAFLKGIVNVTLKAGDVLTLRKTDLGTGAAVTDLLVSVSYSPVQV
jgi:hypothetical protein